MASKFNELSRHLNALLDVSPADAVQQACEMDLDSPERLNLMNLQAAILVDGGALTQQRDAIDHGLRCFATSMSIPNWGHRLQPGERTCCHSGPSAERSELAGSSRAYCRSAGGSAKALLADHAAPESAAACIGELLSHKLSQLGRQGRRRINQISSSSPHSCLGPIGCPNA